MDSNSYQVGNTLPSGRVIVECSICGTKFDVSPESARTKKYTGKPWKCKSCKAQESRDRYKALSPERKQELAEMNAQNSKARWDNMDPEEKKRRMAELGEKFKQHQANMTDDERRKLSETYRESMKKRWANMSDEERDHMLTPMRQQFQTWYQSLSPEEKRQRHDLLQAGNKRWWDSLSPDERKAYGLIRSDASRSYWDNLTPEERDVVSKRQSEIIRTYWENMTDEDLIEWYEKFAEGSSGETQNATENEFANKLGIDYMYKRQRTNSTVTPEFKEKFKINPVNGSTRISPFHRWDFCVTTIDGDVFIDIDGSIHDPKQNQRVLKDFRGNEYLLGDAVAFSDEKRKYQRDGRPAYAVMCYDGKLTDATPVQDLVSGEMMNLRQFMAILSFIDRPGKERKDVIQSSLYYTDD